MALLGKLFKDPEDDETLMGTEDEFYSISEEEAVKESDKTGNKIILWVTSYRWPFKIT